MRILIADDNPAARENLASVLRRWGYSVVEAVDGVEALEQLRSSDAPELVILDWEMPGLDGVEVCRRLRELREKSDSRYVYILLLTGRGDRAEVIAGLEAGADDYLVKPFDPDELRARLDSGRRVLRLQERYIASQQALRDLASRDALTGLWNRAGVLDLLDSELARARRKKVPLAVVIADLDHFKSVNDSLGHLAGDEVLRSAAGRLHDALRPYDIAGRYGGEEFLIILPDCDAENATRLADRLRQAVGKEPTSAGGRDVTVTMSLGVAVSSAHEPNDALALLAAADKALYRAKGEGRNRVCLALPDPDPGGSEPAPAEPVFSGYHFTSPFAPR
jgi:two-component system, cell cycle response regulator